MFICISSNFINMKQPFNNAGVAQFQSNFFTFSMAKRTLEIQAMLNDFPSWMEEKFILSAYQQAQLASMPADFRSMLSTSIAECWESNQPVQFSKETRTEDDRSPKDIIIGQKLSTSGEDLGSISSAGTGLYIWIRYRPNS